MAVAADLAARWRTECPACGQGAAEVAFDQAAWHHASIAAGDARQTMAQAMQADPRLRFGRMLRCRGCGTLFTEHVPNNAALSAFYQTYYGNDGYRGKLARKLGFERRRLFALRWLVRGRRFLDVGCNIGCAVEAARFWGFTAIGLELDGAAVAIAAELFPANRFIQGVIADLPAEARHDLVMCTDVVEHVPDPAGFVARLADTVAPGGVLFLTTPDAGHQVAAANPMSWREMKPPEHQTLFTRPALRVLLAPYFATVRFIPNRKGGAQLIARRAGR